MEFQKVVENRRSIRKYTGKKIDKEKITELVKTAQLAPSWKNSQTARYHVIYSDEMIEKINEALPEFNQRNSNGCSALIITSFVMNRAGYDRDGLPTNELGNGWGIYDCGMSNMVLLLKARDMGLGTLVMGIREASKIKDIIHLPDNEKIISVIAVGEPDIEPEMPARKNIDEICKFYI